MLERDYCLAWFLSGLGESDLKPILGFKGGTALKRCYFGDYRFSESGSLLMKGRITVPDDFGRTGTSEIERLFPGNAFEQSIGIVPKAPEKRL